MNSIKLSRLNETHGTNLPQELLSMTVKDMLDRIEGIDTIGDTEYEAIELILNALSDDVIGYNREQDLSSEGSVEGNNNDEEVDFTEEDDEVPTFSDIDSGHMVNSRPEDSIEDFQF